MTRTLAAVPPWAALFVAALAVLVLGFMLAGVAVVSGGVLWAFGELAAAVSIAGVLAVLGIGAWEQRA